MTVPWPAFNNALCLSTHPLPPLGYIVQLQAVDRPVDGLVELILISVPNRPDGLSGRSGLV